MDILSAFCISTGVAVALSLVALLFFSVSKAKSAKAKSAEEKSATGRRVSLILVGVFGIGAATGGFMLAERDPALQTLPQMQTSFATQRNDLDELQKMSDQDNVLTAISTDYLTAVPSAARPLALFRYGDAMGPLPQVRWNSYRSLLGPFGSMASVERTDFGDVTVYTWNGPWRGLFRMTGYAHCRGSPLTPVQSSSLRRRPCGEGVQVEGTGPGTPDGEVHSRFANYLPLSDGWYAFEIGID